MNPKLALLSGLFAVAAASAALATDTAPVAAPAGTAVATPPKVNDDDKVVCKSEPVTGSRLDVVKRCMTKLDWANESRAGSDAVATRQQQAGFSSPPGH